MPTSIEYYEQIVSVTTDFLGPAAERFVNRQITFHLEKSPGELTEEDVRKLGRWIQDALAVMTKGNHEVQTISDRINQIVPS